MPYLGKSPQHGNYSKIDDISSGFDGSDATHAIASNSIAITPVRPEALIISMNGVIQEPVTDYTVSGTDITFTTAPASGDSFFGVVMGEQLAIGTPSDSTVTSAKLSGNLTTPGTLTVTNSALISGTTPTLTIGDAGAEDTKIVFDGNAQDYYVGLDDTDDDFKIGLGSTVGTTSHIVIDEAGTVTKPLQPAFHVEATNNENCTGGGTTVSPVAFSTERWDVNSDFSSNTFTAPVTGKYLLYTQLSLGGVTTSMTFGHIQIVTSNRTHKTAFHPSNLEALVGGNITSLRLSVVTDMDVSDTATVALTIANGSDVADIYSNIGDSYSYFGGILLA